MQDKLLENLVSKMIKSAHNKNEACFVQFKSLFAKNVQKEQDKNLLNEFDNYQTHLQEKISTYSKDFYSYFANNYETDYLKQAIKIDKFAKAIESRWECLPKKEKIKFLSIKSDIPELRFKYSATSFANDLENKRLALQQKNINMPREAFYEMIRLGYKPEDIDQKNNTYIIPILGKRSKLVFNSKDELQLYIKKHQNNFEYEINKVMEC